MADEPPVGGDTGLDPAILEMIARAIHQAYRRAQARSLPENDLSLRPWETLPETLKRSNRDQAAHIVQKVRLIGCTLHPKQDGGRRFRFRRGEVDALAAIEHERWMAQRLADGWRPGPVRDAIAKTSPLFVPYADLLEPEKDKDRQAVRNIPRLLARAGLRIRRESPR
jgi:RyR domain